MNRRIMPFCKLNGTRRRALVGIVIAVCIYSFWTNYNESPKSVDILRKRVCQEPPNTCHQSVPVKDVIPATTKTVSQNYLHVFHGTDKYSELTPNNISDIATAYKNKWVGFPEISENYCATYFSKAVNNSLFAQGVRRTFPAQLISESSSCSDFNKRYGFMRNPSASQEELDFPIAFIILFYKDIDQVLFLLRAIYQPHNVYCLSIDTKASVEFMEAVNSVSRCLPNVFVASRLESIVYSGFTRLMADIDCMDDLLKHHVQWKYVFNIPGQQFPLRTNLELVKILKKYNGANDVEGITGNRMMPYRYKWKHKYSRDNVTGEVTMTRTTEKNDPPPHKLEIVKGSAYGTFSRAFVDFVVNNPVAKDFLEWSKFVSSPDEYFWATLHHSKTAHAPGGYTAGKPEQKPWLSTYASWAGKDPCSSIHIRGVCIFSLKDLPHLLQRQELFANKFYITHHPAVLHCLDQLLFNLTFTRTTRDLSYYQNLPFALPTK